MGLIIGPLPLLPSFMLSDNNIPVITLLCSSGHNLRIICARLFGWQKNLSKKLSLNIETHLWRWNGTILHTKLAQRQLSPPRYLGRGCTSVGNLLCYDFGIGAPFATFFRQLSTFSLLLQRKVEKRVHFLAKFKNAPHKRASVVFLLSRCWNFLFLATFFSPVINLQFTPFSIVLFFDRADWATVCTSEGNHVYCSCRFEHNYHIYRQFNEGLNIFALWVI